MIPILYLREAQTIKLLNKFNGEQRITPGIAFSSDTDTVFHAFTEKNKNFIPHGFFTACKFILFQSADSLKQATTNLDNFFEKSKSEKELLIFLTVGKNKLEHKGFFKNDKGVFECEIKFVPEHSDLFSRSNGLLETDILVKKSVGIVGLGSGGSPIAIELAKAGIGKFVLIDFDRLELSNVARHVCGINDLGRYKTLAVRDAILQKNPHATIETFEIDVNLHPEICSSALAKVDLIMCASDNDRSRFFLNEVALKYKVPAIFGRAITRAIGGDVLRVRPYAGPCYSCLYSQNIRQEGGDDEEISQAKQAKKLLPDYTSSEDLKSTIQVGLSSDIAPITNFMIKLALVELSKGLESGIKTLEEDLVADYYIWANRRENVYENWSKLEYSFNKPSILRWYGAKVNRDKNCLVCGI